MYIGSTSDFEIRKCEHLGQLRLGRHINKFLQADFNDFKEHNFNFAIIRDGFNTRESMLLAEYELIIKFKSICYNIDTNCPVVSGRNKKSKSLRQTGKILKGKRKPDIKKKKAIRNYKIKTSFPKLDAIIERRKIIEANKAKYK